MLAIFLTRVVQYQLWSYRFKRSGFLWNTISGRENGLTLGKCCTWRIKHDTKLHHRPL